MQVPTRGIPKNSLSAAATEFPVSTCLHERRDPAVLASAANGWAGQLALGHVVGRVHALGLHHGEGLFLCPWGVRDCGLADRPRYNSR